MRVSTLVCCAVTCACICHSALAQPAFMSNATAPDAAPSTDESDALRNPKIALLVTTGLIMAIGAAIPWFIRNPASMTNAINIGTCIAGGFILGGSFIHALPDSTASFIDYFTTINAEPDSKNLKYPFAPLIAVSTMLLLMWIDRESDPSHHAATPKLPPSPDSSVDQRNQGMSDGGVHGSGNDGALDPQCCETSDGDKNYACVHTPITHERPGDNDEPASPTASSEPIQLNSISFGSSPPAPASPAVSTNAAVATAAAAAALSRAATANDKVAPSVDELAPVSRQQAWIFVAALSVHSILDGLGVGATAEASDFWPLFAAVLSHKGFDGFALGVPLFCSPLSKIETVAALVFACCMTPLGLGIGMSITGSSGNSKLARAVLLAISTGTFFFIGMFEMIPRALADNKHTGIKMLCTILAFGIMALIGIWV